MTSFAPIHGTEFHKFSFNGVDLSSGLGEDAYLEFTPNSPLTAVGTDAGSSERYISVMADTSGTMVLTLNAQSPTNLKLNGMVAESRGNGNRPFIGDFTIQRGGTLFLYEARGCHLMERPTYSVGRDMTTTVNTWTFDVAEMREVNINDVELALDLRDTIKADIATAKELSIDVSVIV